MSETRDRKKAELRSLYEENAQSLFSATENFNTNTNGPFLISPNAGYWSAPVRVAFIGQETRGWVSSDKVEEQIAGYEGFNLGENYRASPFWNVIRKLERRITSENYTSAWLNLNRYDEKKKRPSKALAKTLSEIDWILAKELEIIEPHVIIAMTGPSYDDRILKLLGGEKKGVEGLKVGQLCELENNTFAANAFRTYHPKYLRLSKLEDIVIAAIGERVDKNRIQEKT
ncbi:hypothetical protein T35B1_17481 [Salinisphaera shabanensis T35B1]|uniref:hypothetical protein n=1 Tax=Salinisphaera shabanensis TaxID=180542 RepID=UPI0033420F2D